MLYITNAQPTNNITNTTTNQPLLNISQISTDPSCDNGIINGSICCPIYCEFCTQTICKIYIIDNSTNNDINNQTIIIPDSCCGNSIKLMNISCDNAMAPCIINYNSRSSNKITILEISLIIGCSILAIPILYYMCFVIGEKKPPVDYNDIKYGNFTN